MFEALQRLLDDPSIRKVAWNAKRQAKYLSLLGLRVTQMDDVMLMSYVLECGRLGPDLRTIAKYHLELDMMDRKDVRGGGGCVRCSVVWSLI